MPDQQTLPQKNRHSAMSSSALLMSVARALFFARIRASSDQMLLGLGGDSGNPWSELVMWCCPSESEPVALALTIDGIGCSCSPKYNTVCARDYKGATNYSSLPRQIGGVPHPEFAEDLMGFPERWTELED